MPDLRARHRRLATTTERFDGLHAEALPGALRVVRADTWAARRDGLAGLPALDGDIALWIAPCRSVHTLGMRFAIDLVWLDGDGRVIALDTAVAPRRQRTRLGARSVLETAAGRGAAFAAAWAARRVIKDPAGDGP